MEEGDWLTVGGFVGGSWVVVSYSQRRLISLLICGRHIMTGIAAYFNLTWAIWLRYCLNGKQDDVELVWPSIFTSIPVVVRRGWRKGSENLPKRD
jgi:hypothetical protein